MDLFDNDCKITLKEEEDINTFCLFNDDIKILEYYLELENQKEIQSTRVTDKSETKAESKPKKIKSINSKIFERKKNLNGEESNTQKCTNNTKNKIDHSKVIVDYRFYSKKYKSKELIK